MRFLILAYCLPQGFNLDTWRVQSHVQSSKEQDRARHTPAFRVQSGSSICWISLFFPPPKDACRVSSKPRRPSIFKRQPYLKARPLAIVRLDHISLNIIRHDTLKLWPWASTNERVNVTVNVPIRTPKNGWHTKPSVSTLSIRHC